MTGYGRGEATVGTKTIRVEVRSLNGKQLDLNVKMPLGFRSAEYELRGQAARTVVRGKADVYVSVEQSDGSTAATINQEVFADYFCQIRQAAKLTSLDYSDQVALIPAILRLPEVLTCESADVSESEVDALTSALASALSDFDGFRVEEGAVLLADILGHVAAIEELLVSVSPFEKARVGVVRQRIMDHISSLGVAADSNRLEQELVFWVEKLDITEEKVRLAKHCDYFRQTASDDEDAGRKLGFIAQEMGREINTLGSKANDADIQRIVVQMKDELEKIKEQLLNIL